MHRRPLFVLGIIALAILVPLGWTQDVPPAQPAGVQVLARGPIHEAYAQPVSSQVEPSPLVTKPPPDPINEIPPDQKPEGDNVEWIPGYWAWDADQNNYIWVSGFWRVPPPGERWIPGHWQEVEGGWMWVSGYWAPDNLQQVEYLPEPPPTLDMGPSTPAPDANSTYVPGCWVYISNGYRWRPGYWNSYRPNWTWIDAHYIWTPSGCIFNDGYWDHPLDERGLLFAPVQFGPNWGNQPFIPDYVVQPDFLLGALFVGAGRHHYYFGDYFGPTYEKRGFVAWDAYHPSPGVFDPNFRYYSHLHAGDPEWTKSLHELYRARAAGEVPHPPHTLIEQNKLVGNLRTNRTENTIIHKNINLTHGRNVTALTPLKEIHNTRITNLGELSHPRETKVAPRAVKVEPVPKEEHLREQEAAKQIRATALQRRTREGEMLEKGGTPVKHTDAPRSVKVELPKPPPHVVAPRPAVKVAPPRPVVPAHEARPIPKFTPHPAPRPPRRK